MGKLRGMEGKKEKKRWRVAKGRRREERNRGWGEEE